MFSLMLQKLFHKKWMLLCLLIGNILLISVAVSHPLYRTSSFQRMLTDEFRAYETTVGKYPTSFGLVYRKSGGTEGVKIESIQRFVDKTAGDFGIALKYNVHFWTLNEIKLKPEISRDENRDRAMRVATLTDLWDHIELISGRLPKEGITEDGYLEVVVSSVAERAQDLLLDETFTSDKFTDFDGNPIKIRVVGVFRKLDETDCYWHENLPTLNKEGFISEETFSALFTESHEKQTNYGLNLTWYQIWDYEDIKPSEVRHIKEVTASLKENATYSKAIFKNRYEGILESYSAKAKKVEASLLILQVPAMLLLCAFLFMISGQMLQMEQNEISVMKSRGATRGQIIGLYFSQSLFVGIISLAAGVPLGRLICQILGSASNFLEFSATRELTVKYSTDVIYYAGGALLIGILMTVIPVISYSKVGIVNLKQGRHRAKSSLWKITFMDIICLGISIYGYYNFSRNKDSIVEDILAGESLDPMIYFSSSLFILGAGLLLLRLQPLLVKLFFNIFKNHIKPSTYASFLGTIRSGKKQEFIMLFMIMTVALGIFNATVARTIVSNAEANAEYVAGTDIVLKETWTDNSFLMSMDPSVEFKYIEPDYKKFATVEGMENHTKVLNISSKVNTSKISVSGRILGIIPAEFARITTLQDELNPYDMYDYLNVLASAENGAIVSDNFMKKQGLSIGDMITFWEPHFGRITTQILGFFTYWPSYEPYSYETNKDGTIEKVEQYLVVTNLAYLQKVWGVTPYEVWTKTDNSAGIYEYVENTRKLKLSKFNDLNADKEYIRTDTLFQGTNGILTMSFVIVLLLCAVGYLIYWIMSIRSRELLFGVLRAMGMKKREITWMLILEQICSGFYSILAGTLVGLQASKMFVPLVQSAYAADNQVLPLQLITSNDDMLKLFAVILAVMIICLLVIGRIVSKMNISNALKLGED